MVYVGFSLAQEIKLICGYIPQKSASRWDKLDEIAGWLSCDKGLRKLVISEFPDRYYLARIASSVDFTRELRTMGTFELSFFCPDPYGYAIDDEILTITEPGSYRLTRKLGNTSSSPLILVDADFPENTRPTMQLKINDEVLNLSGIWPPNSTLVLDTLHQTAKFISPTGETIGNAMPALERPVFPKFQMGDNYIELTGERLSLREVKIKAQSRWR